MAGKRKLYEVTILRVFTDKEGRHGNHVGILSVADKISEAVRQAISLSSGFSEVVFIDDISKGVISIYTPKRQITFAGHAAVGVGWFFQNILNKPQQDFHSFGSSFKVSQGDGIVWASCEKKFLPSWNLKELESPEQVEALRPESAGNAATVYWSWLNREKGIVRARTFAREWGIAEDEANGSGSMLLSDMLGREITVIHGKGSVILAKPGDGSELMVGGNVVRGDNIKIEIEE